MAPWLGGGGGGIGGVDGGVSGVVGGGVGVVVVGGGALAKATDAATIGGYSCFYVLPLWLLAADAVAAPSVTGLGWL